ncbi:MAG TPA: hypothetical protein VF695_06260 [Sphingomonas sp.]|jgi:hypothetical protein
MIPERFVITLEGKLWNVRRRANIAPNELPHLLAELLKGVSGVEDAIRAHGIRLTLEEDSDQGDDGADDLVVPRG